MSDDRGSGAINDGEPQTVTLSGGEYERYLCGALNPPQEPVADDLNLLGQFITERIAETKTRIDYNAHDLGEFGRMIRVEYVGNILNDLARKLGAS